jgi:NAD+ diphosphatase
MPPVLSDLALVGAPMDRAGGRRRDAEWLRQAWAAPSTGLLLLDARGNAAVEEEPPRLALVSPAETALRVEDAWLLGVQGTRAVFAGVDEQRAHGRLVGLREVGALLGPTEGGLLATAFGLATWHREHGYCPRCGAPTEVAEAGWLRICTRDGSWHHPRVDPAVIMAVIDDDDRLLLGHQSRWPQRRFSTLAGFVEPGETLEQTVAREVHEETGVEVAEVTYLASQPWPFPRSLMLGFTARATSMAITVDGEEIADARWWTRAEMADDVTSGAVLLPPAVSIARRLIEHWYGGALPGGADWG